MKSTAMLFACILALLACGPTYVPAAVGYVTPDTAMLSNELPFSPGQSQMLLDAQGLPEGSYSLSIYAAVQNTLSLDPASLNTSAGIEKNVIQAIVQVRSKRTTKAFVVDVGPGITLGLSGDSFQVIVVNGGTTPLPLNIGAYLAPGIYPDAVLSATFTKRIPLLLFGGGSFTFPTPPFARSLSVTRSPITPPFTETAVDVLTLGDGGAASQFHLFNVGDVGPIPLGPLDAQVKVTNFGIANIAVNCLFDIRF